MKLTTKQAAKYLGCSADTLRKSRQKHRLLFKRIPPKHALINARHGGKIVVYDIKDLRAWRNIALCSTCSEIGQLCSISELRPACEHLAALIFAQGLGKEEAGELQLALNFYSYAYMLNPKNGQYAEAINRIENLLLSKLG